MTILTVTTLADAVAEDDILSLREALTRAQATGGDVTIAFDASLLTDGKGTIETAAALVVEGFYDALTIDGDVDGDGVADITLDGAAHRDTVVDVYANDTTIHGIHISNGGGDPSQGSVPGDGGGLDVHGVTVTFSNGSITNSVAARGGGVYSDGILTLVDSTIEGNRATVEGGGVHSREGTLRNLAILENVSDGTNGGAALYGTVIENATLAGNSADITGALALHGGSSATHVTVTGNTATNQAGGVWLDASSTIARSIVVGSASGTDIHVHNASNTSSIVDNLFGTSGGTDISAANTGDVQATQVFATVVDGAGVAADNGGPVATVALLDDAANPALVADKPATGLLDARGYRVTDGRDLGAYEANGVAPVPLPTEGVLQAGSSPEDEAFSRVLPADLFFGGEGALTITADGGEGVDLPDWVTFDAQTLTLSGTPPEDWNGDLAIRIVATDGNGAVATRDLAHAISEVNDEPVAASGAVAADDAGTAVIDLGRLVSDVDGEDLELSVGDVVLEAGVAFALASGATVTLGADMLLTYVPGAQVEALAGARNGVAAEVFTDTLAYRVADGVLSSEEASIEFTVTGDAAGDNVVRGSAGGDALFGRAGDDRLLGGDGADVLIGNGGADRLNGGEGNDVLRGHRGADSLFGAGGDDLLRGGAGDDRLGGGTGADVLRGAQGRDDLFGRAGDDLLRGGADEDDLAGGRGRDRLVGGAGDDALHGGLGADAFVFAGAFGTDTVEDWGRGRDRIDLGAANTAFGRLVIAQDGADAVIEVAIGATRGTIVLSDTDAGTLGADDFLF